MFKAGDSLKVELNSLSYGGQALYKSRDLVLFVPKGLPEDVVNIKINKIKKNYGTAEITEIVKPSSMRVNPRCKAFEKGCGGCQWLHFNYQSQLFWKTKIVRDALKHIGKINVKVDPIIGVKNPLKYRNKLSLHRDRAGKIGLCEENTHSIVEFDECMQEMPFNVEAYNALKHVKFKNGISQIHIRCNREGDIGIYFYCDRIDSSMQNFARELSKKIKRLKGAGASTYNSYSTVYGEPYITEEIGKVKYTIPHNSFFQTNYEQIQSLLKVVRNFTNSAESDEILDLYCGVGLFALDLARSCRKITGIENNMEAIRGAKYNAKLNRINNVEFHACDAGEGMRNFRTGSLKTLILDPPRTGCDKKAISEIIRVRPENIIYVSCAPDTLSRDLVIFKNSGYSIEACRPIDMFPQTYHVETVVKLKIL